MTDPSTQVTGLTSRLAQLSTQVKPGDRSTIVIRNEMVARAKELIDALLAPEEHVLQRSANGMEIFAIRTVMTIGVLEALPDRGTVSLGVLSAKTGAEESLLERLLRLLVGTRFIFQNEEGEYGHTRFSQAYLGKPGDWFVGILHDTCLYTLIEYPQYLAAHPDQRLVEPSSVTHNVYTWRHGMEGQNTWAVMAALPEILPRFQKGLSMMGPFNPVTGYYPFDQLAAAGTETRPSLVDIGGGLGQCIIDILNAHPSLKPTAMILQDRPEVIALAKTNPHLPAGVQTMAHDFFTPQPVQHARAYYLRYIVHDYADDAVASRILRNVVPAMAPDSRVLIAEAVLPDRVDEASLLGATIDMFMFTLGGKERTKKMFERLLESAGLKVAKIWQAPGSAQAVIEAVLA